VWQSQVKYRGTFSDSIFDFSGDFADFGLFESGKKEQIIWLCTIEFFLNFVFLVSLVPFPFVGEQSEHCFRVKDVRL